MQSEQTQIHTQPARRKLPGWLLAFGIALLAAGIMFLPFIIYEKGNFFFFGDFNVQQIPFYRMAHDAVRSGEVLWNSYTDLGANFIASYSFYLLFSPFFWLTLPFPSEMVPYLMAPLLMLKTASMALTSYFYIRRFVRTDEYAIIGSLCYAFPALPPIISSSTTSMRPWCSSRCCSSAWRNWSRTAAGASLRWLWR